MPHGAGEHRDPPWYLMPIIAPALLLLLLLFPVIALISIPLTWVYPDRHMHIYDEQGTPQQKLRLAQWRAAYEPARSTGPDPSSQNEICQKAALAADDGKRLFNGTVSASRHRGITKPHPRVA